MKHIFIINPTAGVKDLTTQIISTIENELPIATYEVYVTTGAGDALRYVKDYLGRNPHETVRFYSCGGDGTLNEVLNGAIGHPNCEITCYPSGSGNDFLKYFKNPENFLDFKQLIDGEAVSSDVFAVNGRYGLNIFNVGFDAKVVVKQAKIKRWPLVSGKMAYNLGVVSCVLGRLTNKFKITADGEVVYDGKGTLCAIANSICYGGGYYCAPNAKINDGLLDIVFIKKVNLIQFAKLISGYKSGEYVNDRRYDPFILAQHAKEIIIDSDRELYCAVDGEIYKNTHFEVKIVPQAIKFVVPQASLK